MSRIDNVTAFHLALDLIKRAGFVHKFTAQRTESCYYCHPSTPDRLIRVSSHSTKKSPIGLSGVYARLTFTPKDLHHTHLNVRNKVAFAIGAYFLGDTRQTPSEYRGKKGTWENSHDLDL